MFKTSFSKYLTAFIIIIFVSFLALSAIITYMVQNYAFSDTEERLNKESSVIVEMITNDGVQPVEEEIYNILPALDPMVSLISDYDVVITDKSGKIILTSAGDG